MEKINELIFSIKASHKSLSDTWRGTRFSFLLIRLGSLRPLRLESPEVSAGTGGECLCDLVADKKSVVVNVPE